MALMGYDEVRARGAPLLTTEILQIKYSCPDKAPV